jgi:hypothetical protein
MSMLRVGFEPTMLLFEQAKTVYALDCAATVGSILLTYLRLNNNKVLPHLYQILHQ